MGGNYRNDRHQNKHGGNAATTDGGGLNKILVKHVSRLEKEKLAFRLLDEEVKVKRSGRNVHSHLNNEGSLDQVLVKSTSRLEKEKMASAAQEHGDQVRHSVSRREARERELQEAWGGLSLGNVIQPHLSRLEKEKAVWIKAEEEEKRQAMME